MYEVAVEIGAYLVSGQIRADGKTFPTIKPLSKSRTNIWRCSLVRRRIWEIANIWSLYLLYLTVIYYTRSNINLLKREWKCHKSLLRHTMQCVLKIVLSQFIRFIQYKLYSSSPYSCMYSFWTAVIKIISLLPGVLNICTVTQYKYWWIKCTKIKCTNHTDIKKLYKLYAHTIYRVWTV